MIGVENTSKINPYNNMRIICVNVWDIDQPTEFIPKIYVEYTFRVSWVYIGLRIICAITHD